MTAAQTVRLVARREILERGRERSFLISTCVTIAIVIGVAVLPQLLGAGDTPKFTVGTTDTRAAEIVRLAEQREKAFDVDVRPVTLDASQARGALADGRVDAVVSSRSGILTKDKLKPELGALLQTVNREAATAKALQEAGVNKREARAVLNPPELRAATTEPVDPDADAKGAIAFFAAMLLYGQIITFGYLVASGVVEEKASRVVEILLATVRPLHLIAGKIVGLGVLALAQLLVVIVVGLGAALATGSVDIDGQVAGAAAVTLAWFLFGFAFYACAFAVAGALVPRSEELQSSTTPLTLLLLLSFFAAFPSIDEPDGTLATVGSLLPFSSPMIMPIRVVQGAAPLGEVILSVAILIGVTVALVPLAARMYAGAVLRVRGKVRLKEAWRAA